MFHMQNGSARPPILIQAIMIALTLYITYTAWYVVCALALGDWPDQGMLGSALPLAYNYALARFVEGRVQTQRRKQITRYISNTVAMMTMGFALGAMIELSVKGIPDWTWPVPYEWRALMLAFAVFTVGSAVLATRLTEVRPSAD